MLRFLDRIASHCVFNALPSTWDDARSGTMMREKSAITTAKVPFSAFSSLRPFDLCLRLVHRGRSLSHPSADEELKARLFALGSDFHPPRTRTSFLLVARHERETCTPVTNSRNNLSLSSSFRYMASRECRFVTIFVQAIGNEAALRVGSPYN
jgi:hypothetical protein